MRTEKFKVIDFIRQLIVGIDNELENFPNKELELKRRISNNAYDMLEIAYEANSIQNVEKKIELLHILIAKIKVVDFLLNLSNDKKLMTKKKYIKLAQRIDDITKYTCGWVNSLTNPKAKPNIVNE